jgi:hypothetical protein
MSYRLIMSREIKIILTFIILLTFRKSKGDLKSECFSRDCEKDLIRILTFTSVNPGTLMARFLLRVCTLMVLSAPCALLCFFCKVLLYNLVENPMNERTP